MTNYNRPQWAGPNQVPQTMPQFKDVTVDVAEFIRTRDALTSTWLQLTTSLERATKAYLDHTQVVLNGDASLNVSSIMQPFDALTRHVQHAQMPFQQQPNGTVAPMMLMNGMQGMPPPTPAAPMPEEADGKKKRKKRTYKPRDPNAPKRPLTAYFRYLGENRAAIALEMQENPGKYENAGKPGDISKIATGNWNALTKEQQEPYRAAYQAALKEYEKEAERYKAQGGQVEGAQLDGAADSAVLDATVGAAAQLSVDKVDEEDNSDDEESEEEEEPVAPPPPPPAAKKSALKKSKATAEPAAPIAAPAAPAPSSSPDRKRKSTADAEVSTKKRSRKSGADKEVVAAADPVPAPAPVAPMASSPDAEAGTKKRKEKKKRKSDA